MENKIIARPAELTERQERAFVLHKQIIANEQIAASSMLEIGRDLKTMRDERLFEELGLENFGEYCEQRAGIKERQGYNFIRVFEKFGEDKLSKLQGFGIAKLLELAKLDDEDVEEIIGNGDLEAMSVKELKAEVERYKKMTEQLTLNMEELKDTAVSNETDMGVFDEMRGKMEAAEQDNERLKSKIEELEGLADANSAAAEELRQEKENLESELDKLEKKFKDLESKPVEVAVQKPGADEIAKIEKAAAEKAEKAAKKQHNAEIKKLREELEQKAEKERLAAVEKANRDNQAKIEQLESEKAALQANAKKAPPDSKKERLKFYLEECLRNFNKAYESIYLFDESEQPEYKDKLSKFVAKMNETLQ